MSIVEEKPKILNCFEILKKKFQEKNGKFFKNFRIFRIGLKRRRQICQFVEKYLENQNFLQF